MGEAVDLFVVHGEKDLAGLDGGGVVGLGGDAGAATGDSELLTVGDTKLCGILGMNLEIALFGVELAEDFRFVGACLGVPLAAGATAGEEDEGVVFASGFGEGRGSIEEEFCFSTGVVVFSVFEKAAFVFGRWHDRLGHVC